MDVRGAANGPIYLKEVDTGITQEPTVRTLVNQHTAKWKLQNVTTGLHMMDTCWQEASPMMSRRIPTVLRSSAKKTSKLADLSGLLCPSRRLESWAEQLYPFKNSHWAASVHFSEGSKSQLVAGITSTDAHQYNSSYHKENMSVHIHWTKI